MQYQHSQRWRQVQTHCAHHGFGMVLDEDERRRLDQPPSTLHDLPERLRALLVDLGPLAVQAGLLLALRGDVLPPLWVMQLAALGDELPPLSPDDFQRVIQTDLGTNPANLFADFDDEPLHITPIAQTHAARLHSGEDVLVTIQRPDVTDDLETDLAILGEIARRLETRTGWGRRFGAVGLADWLAASLRALLDYRVAVRHAERLRESLVEMAYVHVPFVYDHLTTSRILTLEAVRGADISDPDGLEIEGVDRSPLADILLHAALHGLMVTGYFPADLTGGRLRVDPATGVLHITELALVTTLDRAGRDDLNSLLRAAGRGNTGGLVNTALRLGVAYRPVDELALHRDLEQLVSPHINEGLPPAALGAVFGALMGVLFEHGIRLPLDLTLAIKVLLQTEAIARTLDPAADVLEVVRSINQQQFWERLDPQRMAERLGDDAREFMRLARSMRRATEQFLTQAEGGEFALKLDVSQQAPQTQPLAVIINRLTVGLILIGMTIGSAIAMNVSPEESWSFLPVLGVIGFVASMAVSGVLVWRMLLEMWRRA